MTARTGRRRAAGLIAATLVGVLALAGCSVGGSADQSGGANEDTARGDGLVGAPEAPAGDQQQPSQQPGQRQPAPVKVAPQERSVIYTGSMTVRVDNVEEAADQAGDIAVGAGGLVGGDERTINEQNSRAQLTLRVPADRFESTLAALAGLGEEESRDIQTQDVTEAVLDLEARIISQQASVDRVRALLARAQTIGEVVSVESELTRREAELASLKTRRDRMSDLVALSTITVNLLGPTAAKPDEPKTGFVAGLEAGWDAFLESVKIVLTVAGFLLPWLIAIGVPVWLLIWLLGRRRRPSLAAGAPSIPGTYGLPQPPPQEAAKT